MLTAVDLVGLEHLRLTLVAGEGGSGAPITWAHSSDHPQPWHWLTGGELLLKNGSSLPHEATAQAAFVRGVADIGVSGVVIGLDPQTPALLPPLHRAADERGVPVLTVPYSASFVAIERAVGEASCRDDTGRLASIERIYGAVRDHLTRGSHDGALRRLGRDIGCHLELVDARTGRPVLAGASPPPPDLIAALREELDRHAGRVPGVVHVRVGVDPVLVVEVPDDEPTLLLAHRFRTRPPDLPVLQHLATAAAVLLTQHTRELEHDRRIGAEVFAHLVDGTLGPVEAAARLDASGLAADRSVVLAVHGVDPRDHDTVHIALGRHHRPHLLLRRGEILLVMAAPDPTTVDVLRERFGRDAAIGVSDPVGAPDRVDEAAREATWAAQVARSHPSRHCDYATAPLFSVLRSPDEARALADRTLGPVVRYDRAHDADLLGTLDAFLGHNRSWQRTAAALGVHRQTVAYRIGRIEALTGRRVTDTADLAHFWLALQAWHGRTD